MDFQSDQDPRPSTDNAVVDKAVVAKAVEDHKQMKRTRHRDNILVMLLMLSVLFLVGTVNQSFTAYLTGNRLMPITEIAGRKPHIDQLNLDSAMPYILPSLPADELDAPLAQAAHQREEKQKAKSAADIALKSANKTAALKAGDTAARAQQRADAAKVELAEADTAVTEARAAVARQYANRLVYLSFTTLYFLSGPLTFCAGLIVMWNTLRIFPAWTEADNIQFQQFASKGASIPLWMWNIIVKHYKPSHAEFSKVALAAIMSLLIAVGTFLFSYDKGAGDMQQLLQQTIQHDLTRGVAGQLTCVFDAYSMAISAFLGAVAVCVVWHPRFRDPKCASYIPVAYDPEQEARLMAVQLKQLRLVVYIGTVVLIVRIVQLSAGLNWALAFVTPQTGPVFESVKILINSMVTVRAVYHTILLSAIYFPTSAILTARITALADQQNIGQKADTRKKWLDERDLSYNFVAQVPSLIAVIAPLMAAPLKDLLSRIGM